MQAERARRSSQLFPDGLPDGADPRSAESDGIAAIHASSSISSDSPLGINYIEHHVSKLDTLPGVAIKYGVEVADIKRLNGLMTDIQMYARKTLRIPLPGRHPPSPCLPNGSDTNGSCSGERTPPQISSDVLELLQNFNLKTTPRKASPAMSHLQAYYGLTPVKNSPVLAGSEMPVYGISGFCLNDEPLPTEPPFSDPLLSWNPKSTSIVNELLQKNGDITSVKAMETAENNESEKSIRRRQKNDVNLPLGTPETLLKEDNSNGLSGRKGKGLAMRPKSGSRTDTDMVYQNAVPNGDSNMTDGFVSVRKSSSTSSLLQESENSSSSIWQTSKWNLKPEVLARPLFDSLPKPITPWKKAALD